MKQTVKAILTTTRTYEIDTQNPAYDSFDSIEAAIESDKEAMMDDPWFFAEEMDSVEVTIEKVQ